MRSIFLIIVSGILWFPLGVMYTVQSNGDSKVVRFVAMLKGLWENFG